MAALDFARGALLSRAARRFEDRLRDLAFDAAIKAGRRGGGEADQPLRDLRRLRLFLEGSVFTAMFDALWTPFFIVLVFLMHWALGLLAAAGLLILAGLELVSERASRTATLASHGQTIRADRLATAVLRNSAAADAMGMRGDLKARWTTVSDEANDGALVATDRIGGLTATTKAVRLFLQSAILGMGAYLAIGGSVSAGVMIAAAIITGRALAPIEVLTGQWRTIALAWASRARLHAAIGETAPQSARTALPAPSGALNVVRLYCQPGNAKAPALKNVSFKLGAGETLGVIGPSAAGKSTLARALVGVEAPVSGEVQIDGANLGHWDQEALGKFVGFMPQEVELFSGTASENIARFSPGAPADRIIAAARAAGAHDMILSFPNGYDTEIGDGGRHLSAGQRQRLALARALYGDPALVVLDEPNANLDEEGEAALVGALRSLKARGATTVIIAHRRGLIEQVDKLLLLIQGEARAFGPRDEVMRAIAPGNVTRLTPKSPTRQAEGGAGE
jgi:PrtD family type I secretion system ABC transporter